MTGNYRFKNKNTQEFGKGLLIEKSEFNNYYHVRGNYEIKNPLVHEISKLTQLNGTEYMRLEVPNQKEISDMMQSINQRVKDEQWFTEELKGQNEFSQFEKYLRKALAEFRLNDNSKLGLLGELSIINSLIKRDEWKTKQKIIIDAWSGYQSTSRDFIFDKQCIEVKTTTKHESTHEINNLNQVDPRDDDGGITELFLASIGLDRKEDGYSIVSMTNSILEAIEDEELKQIFLENIRHYGVNSIGYDHNRMANWTQFQESYQMTFRRFYNMADPKIKVIRFSDIVEMKAVNERSLSYQINLDENIEGASNNPMTLEEFSNYLVKELSL